MANINDYLEWRGDIPFSKEFPFNEVDSMIMARFSYLLFDKIKMQEKETIASIAIKMQDFKNEAFLYNGDKELITNLGISARFKDLIVTDFVKKNDKCNEEQFGAITIHLASDLMYISYLGTDNTIYGWKEDFNMGFMDNVPCQVMGKIYLENLGKKYPEKKILLGGHSKGGNVAIYAAITSLKSLQERIIKVYNYDGPGFNKKIIDKYETKNILKKIETYIPQDSIIGRVLYHKEKTTIVLSLERGILEHDIFSWQVFHNDIVKIDQNTDMSELIDKTLTDWILETTNEQRQIFIDTIFEIFYSTNANSFGEMVSNLKDSLPKILKKYTEIPEKNKEVIGKMVRKLIKSYMNILKNTNKNKIIKLKDEYIAKEKKVILELEEKYNNIKNNFQKKND